MPQTPVPATAPAVADLDALFRGFADPTRLRILNVLAAGELCVGDIVDVLRLPQPTVSRHLGYLRRTGLVEVTREWNVARYRLAEATHPVHHNLLDCVRSCFRGIRSLDRERARGEARVRQRTLADAPAA
jgi:ArsR family transcriptional regulator, arsenate/arsenite/antimonite-responsive transcriptional repressor